MTIHERINSHLSILVGERAKKNFTRRHGGTEKRRRILEDFITRRRRDAKDAEIN